MRAVWAVFALLSLLVLSGCSPSIHRYVGPEVTRILVYKESRRMYLMYEDYVLKAYDIDLGFAPVGDKQIKGDGKTPVGEYIIDRRNPNSEFFLSLGISYPNEEDIAEAEAAGVDPGGDIFIHGESRIVGRRGTDWTWGCPSMKNEDVDELYSVVQVGTVVEIVP